MNPFLNSPGQELTNIMYAFGNTNVEDLAPRGYKKYVLNKLRWIPIDFGISHFKLAYPPMPILDLILIGASLEDIIDKGSIFDSSAFYEILAARNIIKLLNRAYNFNQNVKMFYDLKIPPILSFIADDEFIDDSNKLSKLPELLKNAAIDQNDTVKDIADFILNHLESIAGLSDYKNTICLKITNGTCEERNILFAYELYFLLFPMLLSWSTPISPLYLCEKYHKRSFWNDYDITPIDTIREYAQKKGRDS